MSMTKKDFIALADHLANAAVTHRVVFSMSELECIADLLETQNPRFNRGRWFGYLMGECGPSGGAR